MISAKKNIFAYFLYLACLNKILQSLNFPIPYWEKKSWRKVSKLITSDHILRQKC